MLNPASLFTIGRKDGGTSVGGELWAHNESGKINRDLVIANNSLEARKDRENEVKLATLNANAKGLEAGITDAKVRAKTAEATAEKERVERLKLEKEVLQMRIRLADRHLTPEEKKSISEEFCKLLTLPLEQPPHLGIQITLVNSNNEISAFGRDILSAIPQTCPVNGSVTLGWIPAIATEGRNAGFSGIRVYLSDGASSGDRQVAEKIVSVLSKGFEQVLFARPPISGVTTSGGEGRVLIRSITFVHIDIGAKP